MNDEAVYRTAPATPGLLKKTLLTHRHLKCLFSCTARISDLKSKTNLKFPVLVNSAQQHDQSKQHFYGRTPPETHYLETWLNLNSIILQIEALSYKQEAARTNPKLRNF